MEISSDNASEVTYKTLPKESQGLPQLSSYRLPPGSADHLDVVGRFTLLEDHISRCFEKVVARLELLEAELLEAETMQQSAPSMGPQQSMKEALEEIPGLASLLAREDRSAHMRAMKMAAKSRNASAIVTGVNTFIIDSLPLYRIHWVHQETLHKYTRLCCFSTLVIFFVLFVSVGFYKLCTPIERDGKLSNFVKISHEVKMWQREELQTPRYLCIGELSEGLEVAARHSEIPYGQHNMTMSTSLQLVTQDIQTNHGVSKNAKCVTSQLSVVGFYGDPIYKYISFDILAPENHSVLDPQASLFLDTQVGALDRANTSYYYTFLPDAWTGVEVFLGRITLIKGDMWGVSTMFPKKYKELWGTKDVAVSKIYSRLGRVRNATALNKRTIATWYIRPSSGARDDTYTPYGFTKLLMDSGGLWTSLAMLVASSMVLCFLACNLCPSAKTDVQPFEAHNRNTQKQKGSNDRNVAVEVGCDGVVPAPTGSAIGRGANLKRVPTVDPV